VVDRAHELSQPVVVEPGARWSGSAAATPRPGRRSDQSPCHILVGGRACVHPPGLRAWSSRFRCARSGWHRCLRRCDRTPADGCRPGSGPTCSTVP